MKLIIDTMCLYLFLVALLTGLVSAINDFRNVTEGKLDTITIGSCSIYLKSDCPDSLVTYFIYTNIGEEQVLLTQNGNNLEQTSFNPMYETKILIHGYSSNRFLEVLQYIKNEYIQRGNFNVFMVDWENLARGPCYPAAVWNCRVSGKCAANLIEAIQQASNAKIHVIGFSLGAHVAGFISNYLTSKIIDRITGLDPALPGFATVSYESKLDPSDAQFVDVIHTNAFMKGTPERLGHVDFYFNGGILQPGCWDENSVLSCSHHRAPSYFGESINSVNGFWGWPCKSYFDYLLGRCLEPNFQTLIGEYVNRDARGMYVAFTNSLPPFAKGPYNKFFPPYYKSQDMQVQPITDSLTFLLLNE